MVEAVAQRLSIDPDRLRRYMLAALASLSLNAVLLAWLTRAIDEHPASLGVTPAPIVVDIINVPAPTEPMEPSDAEQPPQPVFETSPEVDPVEEAPMTTAPPEERTLETAAGAVAAEVDDPPLPEPSSAPTEASPAARPQRLEVPPEWTVDRRGATLEELGESPYLAAPQSGAGDTGSAAALRRALNEAACADLQLSIKLGRNCPPVGAYARYADNGSQLISEEQSKRLQLSFPRSFLDDAKPVMDRDGALPQATGENLDYFKQGASSGMVGTLPNPDAHPYTQ